MIARPANAIRVSASLLAALALFVGVRVGMATSVLVRADSMNPALQPGDVVLVRSGGLAKLLGRWTVDATPSSPLRRCDVVLLRIGGPAGSSYLKRIVGVPSDTLEMKAAVLYRNGARVEEAFARHSGLEDLTDVRMGWQQRHRATASAASAAEYSPTRDTWGPLVVPAGVVFVLGDNRDRSMDSRHFGFVAVDGIEGRATRIVYSYHPDGGPFSAHWDRMGRINRGC